MESFFNNTFKHEDIVNAWNTGDPEAYNTPAYTRGRSDLRSAEEELLQPYNDALFNAIYESMMTKQEVVFRDLCITRSATLWNYRETRFPSFVRFYSTRILMARRRGWDEVISSPERSHTVSVGEVVRKTDILARLALVFGPEYTVSIVTRGTAVIPDVPDEPKSRYAECDDTDAYLVSSQSIVVTYTPSDEITDRMRSRHVATAIKYAKPFTRDGT
jgi:hypothetical protein